MSGKMNRRSFLKVMGWSSAGAALSGCDLPSTVTLEEGKEEVVSYLMPEEGKANGLFIVDGSMAGIGKIEDEPIKIIVENGMAVKVTGGKEARKLNQMIEAVGERGRNLAELGVGTNYMAIITGEILEDEKVAGTVHLALGNNVSMGGTVDVGFHVDGIITKPTLKIDDTYLLKNGEMTIS